MEGMPERVSAVSRTTLDKLVAALGVFHQVNGGTDAQRAPPCSRESAVMVTVLMMAGIMETFSVVYVQANRSGVRCGMPLIRM